MQPEQGEHGLWYAGTVGFATKEEAQAYIDRGLKHQSALGIELQGDKESKTLLGYPRYQWVLAIALATVIIGVALWFKASPSQRTERVGREFTSMQECLGFIENDAGEQLVAISDKPGDVSGKTAVNGLFFRCEVMRTGTRGLVLEGRWDRLK